MITFEPFIIAIDGLVASGKSTLAQRLGQRYGFPHLNTGLLYRAVAFAVNSQSVDESDHAAVTQLARALAAQQGNTTLLDNPLLMAEENGQRASRVAQIQGVRDALMDWQRNFPIGYAGAVLDGRDITTTIFPNAPAKILVIADVAARADRRLKQGITTMDRAALIAFIQERDDRDRPRYEGDYPDRITIDTTHLNADAAEAVAVAHVEKRMKDVGFTPR